MVPFFLYCFDIWAKEANLNVTDEKNCQIQLKKSSNLSVHVYVNAFKKGLSNVYLILYEIQNGNWQYQLLYR